MSELPRGWALTTLGDVADWGSGGTPSRSEPSFYGGQIPWIKSGELNGRYVTTTEEYITEAAIKSSSAKLFPAGSVAMAMYGATIGKTAILGIEACTNQACAVGAPIEGIIGKEFLYRLLQNEKEAFIKKGKGGAQPNISQAVIKAHEIGLPPLAEQTRIAQKLDELLAQVDILKARIDAIPALLKRFRQSVLAAAVSGRLTEEWRTHQSIEASQNSLHELPAGWAACCFGDLCNILHGYAFQSEFFADTGPVVLTPGNFTEDGKIDFTTKRVVRLRGDYDPKWMLHNGDLLIVMTDLSPKKLILGKTVKLQSGEVVLHNQRIGKVVPNSNLVFSDYLRIALLESRTKQTIDETATGTVVQHTSPKKILAIKTALPPLAEQTEIVRRIEQLFAFADQLETKVASAKSRIDHITQSILAKAFRGELVPQDPCDEPASVLLERIKTQRAAAPKAKRSRKSA